MSEEIKPVGWIVPAYGEEKFFKTKQEAQKERAEFEKDCEGDCDHYEPEPAYALPATHRIVPVELLERALRALPSESVPWLCDGLRHIIDEVPT